EAIPGAYDQSQLVSFYYQSNAPFDSFRETWFTGMKDLERIEIHKEAVATLEKLAKRADAVYENMQETGGMLEQSPLLKEAHTHYLKSLKLFSQEAGKFITADKKINGKTLKRELDTDPGILEAKRFALIAQNEYYNSILKWNLNMTPELKDNELTKKEDLTTVEWNQLNLNQKNVFLTNMMLLQPLFANFAPQDLAVKVDTLLDSSQEGKIKFKHISEAVKILVATGAISNGDYLAMETTRYDNEIIPLVPSLVQP
ncbi:MAG: hypothetical protein H7X86_12240, partial [Gorillibacterium sp.]|nr:hypothetical protein [Gorillibacterium sp.]